MKPRKATPFLALLVAMWFAVGCEKTETPTEPLAEQAAVTAEAPTGPSFGAAVGGPGPTGALFTTTPDGGIVNENVRYERKIEVYLDGGPPPNAPQHAAGNDDGLYVFQVTDPSGWALLSSDPSKCRVIEIKDAVIIRRVPPSELPGAPTDSYTQGKGSQQGTFNCHEDDDPAHPTYPGVAGASGHHDTNVDNDHGGGAGHQFGDAIVVQLMPFEDTPNPGGVYKAWITPLSTYLSRDGDLDANPEDSPMRGRAAKTCPENCFQADDGFGPPRSVQKTDNFKVKEVPPMIHVYKFEDLDGDGVKDAGEPMLDGWKIQITETLADGTKITNDCYTPCWRTVAPNSTVTVTEVYPAGEDWQVSYLDVDGSKMTAAITVDVTFAPGDMEHSVTFGNWEYATKKGEKWEDHLPLGTREAKDQGLDGWTINLDGFDGTGTAYSNSDVTSGGGFYSIKAPPGTYDVCEVQQVGWLQTFPTTGYDCKPGTGYTITLKSGEIDSGNDFGNTKLGTVEGGLKFIDYNADGIRNGADGCPASPDPLNAGCEGVLVTLESLPGPVFVDTTRTNSAGTFKFEGLIPGVQYQVLVKGADEPVGFYCTTANKCVEKFIVDSGGSKTDIEFGDSAPVKVVAEKFVDLDGDGVKDPGEGPGEGFEFCLNKKRNGTYSEVVAADYFKDPDPACQTTGVSGVVTWDNLIPGEFKVIEKGKDGWVPTTDDYCVTGILDALEDHKCLFGNQPTHVRQPADPRLHAWILAGRS
jgi:hypothetical protein